MSLYSDLNEVLTPYAKRIKSLAAADEEIKADLGNLDTKIDNIDPVPSKFAIVSDLSDSIRIDANTNYNGFIIKIEPAQSGSGTPTPTNVRAISGISDNVVLMQSQEGGSSSRNINIPIPSAAGTIYGGVIDTNKKKLTIDRVCIDLSALNWSTQGTGFYVLMETALPDIKLASSGTDDYYGICDIYNFVSYNVFAGNSTPQNSIAQRNDNNKRLYVRTDGTTETRPSGHVVLMLNEPIEYDIQNVQISLYSGVNIFSVSGQKISVTYTQSANKILDIESDVDALAEQVDGIEGYSETLDDLIAHEVTWTNIVEPTIYSKTNSAVTNNGDGTFTLGITGYGNIIFDSLKTLAPGEYELFGVPAGFSFVNTVASQSGAFVTNNTSNPVIFKINETTECYIGYRNTNYPSEELTLIPYLKQKTYRIETVQADIEEIRDIIAEIDDDSANDDDTVYSGGYGLSTDAQFYVNRIPSYFISPETTPTTFEEARSYLDRKIDEIPKAGKSFIYVCDTHWGGNQKHSNDIINYVRKRTGIRKVLFGGDVYGYASDRYGAVKIAGEYLDEARRNFGFDFIPCVGDHDNNTAIPEDSIDTFVPYVQIEKLFVGDLERCADYHYYDPSEKLANYVTPGTDAFNECMAFFHTVYYYDDKVAKIRYIVLNSGTGSNTHGEMYETFGSTTSNVIRLQYDWLVETLMSTPTGYDIFVLGHKTNFNVGASSTVNAILSNFKRKNPSTTLNPSGSGVANIESWWQRPKTYNFGNAPDVGRVIAFNAHRHQDCLFGAGYIEGENHNDINGGLVDLDSGDTIIQPLNVAANAALDTCQIPIILTATDSLGAAEGNPMVAGTITEQCFDVITLLEDRIVMTRIGCGSSRVLYISEGSQSNP